MIDYGKGAYGFNQDKSHMQIGGNWQTTRGAADFPNNETWYGLGSMSSLRDKYSFIKVKLYEGDKAADGQHFSNCVLYDEIDLYIGGDINVPSGETYTGPYPVRTTEGYLSRPVDGGGIGTARVRTTSTAFQVYFSANMPAGRNIIEIYGY